MNLLELLRCIGRRPGFYLGDPTRNGMYSIWDLQTFLVGYQCGNRRHPTLDGDDVLDSFTFWVCTRYNVSEGPMSWAGHLWSQSGNDGEAGFKLFFELLEEYIEERNKIGPSAIEARFRQMMERKTT